MVQCVCLCTCRRRSTAVRWCWRTESRWSRALTASWGQRGRGTWSCWWWGTHWGESGTTGVGGDHWDELETTEGVGGTVSDLNVHIHPLVQPGTPCSDMLQLSDLSLTQRHAPADMHSCSLSAWLLCYVFLLPGQRPTVTCSSKRSSRVCGGGWSTTPPS